MTFATFLLLVLAIIMLVAGLAWGFHCGRKYEQNLRPPEEHTK